MGKDKRYHIINTDTSRLGRFMIRLDTVEENGKEYPYSFVRQKNSVGILGFVNGKLILIHQYRHTLENYEYEIPGGGIETDEEPISAAAREMIEETGYRVESITELGKYYPSPGTSDETCFLFAAQCRKEREPEPEPLEYIKVVLVDENKFVQMIKNGVFRHSMGLVAWLKYSMERE